MDPFWGAWWLSVLPIQLWGTPPQTCLPELALNPSCVSLGVTPSVRFTLTLCTGAPHVLEVELSVTNESRNDDTN